MDQLMHCTTWRVVKVPPHDKVVAMAQHTVRSVPWESKHILNYNSNDAVVGVILESISGKVKQVGATRLPVDMQAPYHYDLTIGKTATGITELYLQRKRNGDALDRGRRLDAQTHSHTQHAFIRTRTYATASLHIYAHARAQRRAFTYTHSHARKQNGQRNADSGPSMTRGVWIKNTRETNGRT
jgi:hypothetical protein